MKKKALEYIFLSSLKKKKKDEEKPISDIPPYLQTHIYLLKAIFFHLYNVNIY